MYATLGHTLPRGAQWTFEPKYDGMRVIADAKVRAARLVTCNGKEKSGQFPELDAALRDFARAAGRSLVLDGEVGAAMLARARRAGWEGIIAKRTDVPYQPGTRSHDWLKLKLQFRAEFVVGGFTEPRETRESLGALLLGAYDEAGRFVYVGHTGGGFTNEGLRAMHATLARLERKRSPFVTQPRTNEKAHWMAPKVVVEVKFAEWTASRLLRQPIFLGVRDDKAPGDVTIEGVSAQRWSSGGGRDGTA